MFGKAIAVGVLGLAYMFYDGLDGPAAAVGMILPLTAAVSFFVLGNNN